MAVIEMFATKSPCWKANATRADSRYANFQDNGPSGLMLHSVGCAQPSAEVFVNRWNREDNQSVMCHGVIDANDGNTRQALKWNYRGWHCAGTGNNTHIGVEMGESSYIKYRTDKPWLFDILDKAKAQQHCRTAYNGAVELFAMLCKKFNLNPLTQICSHKEGNAKGIASAHGDPEHYWAGLGMPYTMDGFRSDVKAKMEEAEPAPSPAPTGKLFTEAEVEAICKRVCQETFKANFEAFRKLLQDNDCGNWSKEAREWAIANGVIAGVGNLANGKPNYAWQDFLTREQMAQIEYRLHHKD